MQQPQGGGNGQADLDALIDRVLYDREFQRAFANDANARLMGHPIDILCFGAPGVGKSSLLTALSGINFHPTDSQTHGTTKLTIEETTLPGIPARIRFCDTRGVNLMQSSSWWPWAEDDVDLLFKEIRENNVEPFCVLYCTSANNRADPSAAKRILSKFHLQCPIFWVVTNMCTFQIVQLDNHLAESRRHMSEITHEAPTPVTYAQRAHHFGRSAVVPVNSQPFHAAWGGGVTPEINIGALLELILSAMDRVNLLRFFLFIYNQNKWWRKAWQWVKEHKAAVAVGIVAVAAGAAVAAPEISAVLSDALPVIIEVLMEAAKKYIREHPELMITWASCGIEMFM